MNDSRGAAGSPGLSSERSRPLRVSRRMIFAFSAVILVVSAIGIALVARQAAEVRAHFLNSVRARFATVSSKIEQDVDRLREMLNVVSQDYDTRKLVATQSLDNMTEVVKLVRSTNRMLSALVHISVLAESASLYVTSLDRVVSTDVFYREMNGQDREFIDTYMDAGAKGRVFTYRGDVYFVVPLTRRVLGELDPMLESLLVLRIGAQAVAGMLESVSNIADLRAAVLSCGSVVATVGTDPAGFADLHARASKHDDVRPTHLGATGYRWFSQPIENMCGELSVFVPQRALSINTTRYRVWLVVMTCVAVGSFTAFVFIVDAAVRKPLARLMDAFAELEHDNLISLDHDIEEDFSFVYSAFNGMTARLRGAIEQIYVSTIATQQAELRHLQSQINPHFLYNSFCHIRRMAKMGDLDGVDEMSRKLSEYYRYITKTDSEFIPLRQEVDHAQAYVDIQRIRFGDRVVATIEEVPGEWAHRPVPKLILQPLIENAYVHGLEGREDGGQILVRFEERGELLSVCIEDDGDVHSDSYIAKMRQAIDPEGPRNGSTGILNVRRRLQLSGAGDMVIDRSPSGGLLVRIALKKDDVACTKSLS